MASCRDHLELKIRGFDDSGYVKYADVFGDFVGTPLPQGVRAHLPPDCTASAIIDRILRHIREKWSEDAGDTPVEVGQIKEVLDRLTFLEKQYAEHCQAQGAKVKHLLCLFLYCAKVDYDFSQLWVEFFLEQNKWVPSCGEGGFSIQCSIESCMIKDLQLHGNSQPWIYAFLLSDGFVETLREILANPGQENRADSADAGDNLEENALCHVTADRIRQLISEFRVHLVRFDGLPSVDIDVQGWTTFDGVVIVPNKFPSCDPAGIPLAFKDVLAMAIAGYVLELLAHETAHTVLRLACGDLDTSSPFCKASREASGMQALRNEARKMLIPGAEEPHAPIRTNFELGVMVEKLIFGIVFDYQKALQLKKFDLIKTVVTRLMMFPSETGGQLPLISRTLQAEIELAHCRDYSVALSFGKRCQKRDKKRRF